MELTKDAFYISIEIIKLFTIVLVVFSFVPFLVWLERRASAFMQNRFGPNRVGPLGLVQTLADAIKFSFKENFVPEKKKAFFFYLAPILAMIPGIVAFGAIPFASPLELSLWGEERTFFMQGFHFGAALVYVLAISSLATFSTLLAGWSSRNKFSLMGALRAAAQMISYELALGMALVGIVVVYGSLDFSEIISMQRGPLTFTFFSEVYQIYFLPKWGVFYQPLSFLLVLVCIFAESNRMPFDMPEAEAELVSGYHTDYGGLKMLLFYIGEYAHMIVGSALVVTLYFGGYELPYIDSESLSKFFISLNVSFNLTAIFVSLITMLVFFFKVMFFLWFFIWIRWTVPRFKYQQLMDLGWKKILPLAILNTLGTAVLILAFNGV